MAYDDEWSLYSLDYENLLLIAVAMRKLMYRFVWRVVAASRIDVSLMCQLMLANDFSSNCNE